MTLDDIKRFVSSAAGAPVSEYRWTSGVETTTGPLGRAGDECRHGHRREWLASFNRPGFDLFDYDVYALCGDGCMMEGISSEAASLAGHLALGNLCWIYDNNHITIEGNTALAYSDDVATRFIGYGWNVTRVGDANDLDMLDRAFRTFKHTADRPTSSSSTATSPTAPRTSRTRARRMVNRSAPRRSAWTKRGYGWPEDAKFLVPDGVREHFDAGIGACVWRCTATGGRCSSSIDPARWSLRRPAIACCAASCPTAGIAGCRRSPPTTRASRRATPRARR